ncbi:ATP-binding protein [Prauserella sp. ASG 168]|uniref:histidine kinase n=2 Tax=Prauserella cavernicola TaxID=2800127 RepID=A0A934V3P6_9PSEU|nr:ATP-binding protein [Prauserella cavernicola]
MRVGRRLRHLAGPVDTGVRDGLLLRAARNVALVPIAYRLLAVPGAFATFAGSGGAGLAPVAAVAACSVVLNLLGAHWLLRRSAYRDATAALLLGLDVVFTLVANLVIGATVPPESLESAAGVPGKHLLGAVALLTLALGVGFGAALAVLGIPLRAAMSWLSGDGFDLGAGLTEFGTTLGVLLTATAALVLLGLGTRLALAYGIRTGRLAERAVQQRYLHDTALQALEAMALPGDGTDGDAERLRRIARAEAIALRARLESESGGQGGRLAEKLAALAADMARDGLRAQLVAAEPDGETLSEVRQIAVRDAVREALRNTLKHSGADTAIVRVEERDGGIATIIRDHGAGFVPEDRTPGFGIGESIVARLAEVGGTAKVESAPGNGTRVTLWVPR